jgi:hypothetical protein
MDVAVTVVGWVGAALGEAADAVATAGPVGETVQ